MYLVTTYVTTVTRLGCFPVFVSHVAVLGNFAFARIPSVEMRHELDTRKQTHGRCYTQKNREVERLESLLRCKITLVKETPNTYVRGSRNVKRNAGNLNILRADLNSMWYRLIRFESNNCQAKLF